VPLDGVADRVLAGDNGEDVAASYELEIVQHPGACRIGHRDREGASVALEGKHEVLGRHLARDEARDAGVDLEVGEVDSGHAVLTRERSGEVDFLYETERDEAIT
jgi:hypothetical protein